jgi:hypothetical protein
LMRTTLTFLSCRRRKLRLCGGGRQSRRRPRPFYLPDRWPGPVSEPRRERSHEKSLMEGPGRAVRFVVYSSVARGNIPMRYPFGGSAKIAVIPGDSLGKPSLVSRRAVPAPVRRLAFFVPGSATPGRAGTVRSPRPARRRWGYRSSPRWLRCCAPSRRRPVAPTGLPRRAGGIRRPDRRAP